MFQNRSMIKIAFHLMSLNEAESKPFQANLSRIGVQHTLESHLACGAKTVSYAQASPVS